MNRREFLAATAGAAAGLLAGCDACGRGSSLPLQIDPKAAAAPPPDLELSLRAAPGRSAILDGAATDVWRFSAKVLRGSADARRWAWAGR